LTIAKPQTAHLFDTISAGYEAVNRRPRVLIVPALVNILLWLSAPLPLDGLSAGLSLRLVASIEHPALRGRLLAWLQSLDMRLALAPLNVVPLLGPLPSAERALSLPSALQSPVALVGLALLLNGLALLLSGGYLAGLAGAVANSRPGAGRPAWQVCLVIGEAVLAVVGVVLLLAMPFIALSLALLSALPQLAPLVAASWYVIIFWGVVYSGFIGEGAAIGALGPLRAIYASVNLVRRNLAATLSLLALSLLVSGGMGSIFRRLASESGLWAILLASVCSAYLGSGLAAARMVFYRERLAQRK
jgi:hypothetical protein